MSATVLMLVLGWLVVALLAGIIIGGSIRLADEAEAADRQLDAQDRIACAQMDVWL